MISGAKERSNDVESRAAPLAIGSIGDVMEVPLTQNGGEGDFDWVR